MKCLHRAFVKNGEGEVKLVPEEGVWREQVCDWLCQACCQAYSNMLRCAGRDTQCVYGRIQERAYVQALMGPTCSQC